VTYQLIYNTMSRKKETFEPFDPKFVKVYTCGPTPYDLSHVGHARTFVFFDVAIAWLRDQGYNVDWIMNITDVDDKMINRARELGIPWEDFKELMIYEFLKDLDALGVYGVSMLVRATDVIPEMIEIIKTLIEKGYAYVTPDGVYFDVSKFPDYGKLSKIPLEELKKHRIEPSPYKRNPADFALWKLRKYDYEPAWESPWGLGRPGWHIECSTMIYKYLGPQIDIHGGGSDLIFPHHENEIAQSEAFTGKKPFVKYWMHVGMVTIEGEKMSKSLGNIVTIREVLQRYDAASFRWFLLSAHYRKPLDFSWEHLERAKKHMERLRIALRLLEEPGDLDKVTLTELYKAKLPEKFEKLIQEIENALRDDFNTAVSLARFQDLLGAIISEAEKLSAAERAKLHWQLERFMRIFGFRLQTSEAKERELLKLIAEVRTELRKRKLYEISDRIRERLIAIGYHVADTKDGSRIY
jgi:cysteinyl-tRNA synthetase